MINKKLPTYKELLEAYKQRKKYTAKWYGKCNSQQRAQILKNAKNYRARLKFEVFSHYSGNPPKCACINCDETNIKNLTIDHINGGGNRHKQQIIGKIYCWLKKNNYPSNFQVLCLKCNIAKGINNYCSIHHKQKNFT